MDKQTLAFARFCFQFATMPRKRIEYIFIGVRTMSGTNFLSVPRMAAFGFPTFGEDILDAMFDGEMPKGIRTYKQNILDDNGNKIGTKVVRTYSSGRSNAPASLVGSNYPPCNIYTDENRRKVYEFAVAGYDPKNISFAVDENNPSYINLILKSGLTEVKESETDDNDDKKEEEQKVEKAIIYDYQKFVVKDHTCPFYVDRDRYDIEQSTVEFKNGTVKISFEPKKVDFNPKVVN